MSYRKTRVFLEPHCPARLIVAGKQTNNKQHTIELTDFEITQTRVTWQLLLGTGEIIEGRLNTERPLPFWPGAWVTLSLPITVNARPRGTFAPNFVFYLPDVVNFDFAR